MKTIAQFVLTTILGGVFFLAPIVVLIVILAKAFDYAKKGLNAVFVHIPAASDLSAGAATALTVVVVALVCFLAGLVACTMAAQRVIGALKSSVLSNDSCVRLPEAGERKRAGRRRDRGTPRGLRAYGRVTASSRIARAALALRYGTSVCAQSRAAIPAPFPCIVDIVKLRHALLNKAWSSGSSTAPGRIERTPTPHDANARLDRVNCH